MDKRKGSPSAETPARTDSRTRRQRWTFGLTIFAALFALSWGLRIYVDSAPSAGTPPAGAAVSQVPPALPRASASPAAAPTLPAALPLPAAFNTPSEPVPADIRQKLVGRWVRPDGGYVMTLSNLADGDGVEVTYANPNPVHVERVAVHQAAGKTSLYVELRDRNYPGNNYELEFDSAKDQFIGLYHHLGVHEDFAVYFERVK